MNNKKLQFLETAPIAKNKADNLVLLLHGYGSSGQDIIALASEFAKTLPNSHFIAPNAPFNLNNPYYPGYQWFGLDNYDPQIMYPQIIAANDILDQFIAEQLARLKLAPDRLMLIGFSQGSMMAMYNALRAKEQFAGVAAYSGKLILPTNLAEKINSKPPICLIHGTDDEVVPFANMIEAQQILKELHNPFEAHEIKGLGHSINLQGLNIAKKFLTSLTA